MPSQAAGTRFRVDIARDWAADDQLDASAVISTGDRGAHINPGLRFGFHQVCEEAPRARERMGGMESRGCTCL